MAFEPESKPEPAPELAESMALAHAPPVVGAGRGGGSRRPGRLSNAPRSVVGEYAPLLGPPPQGGMRAGVISRA
jgi:hypothetical protein